MLKYPCLILDHDDTVVQSETTVNYPFFCYILDQYRPGQTISLGDYTRDCFSLSFSGMCRKRFQFTEQELADEFKAWHTYASAHIPPYYPGIENVIRRQKEAGGLVCVVSHSSQGNILRDYRSHFGIEPDAVYSWDLPAEQRKPSVYPLMDIMRRFQLLPPALLMVDDMQQGYEMAHKAEVPMAFAAWSHQDIPEILAPMRAQCDFSFDSPAELEHFLFD